MRPWSQFDWYRSGVRGCAIVAVVLIVLLWLVERLAGWLFG